MYQKSHGVCHKIIFNDQLTTQLSFSEAFSKAIGNYYPCETISYPVIRIIYFLTRLRSD